MSKASKRKKILDRVTWFIPTSLLKLKTVEESEKIFYGIKDIGEDSVNGTQSVDAFFAYTDNGIRPTNVTDLRLFLNLIIGLQRMTLQMQAWSEGFREGSLFLMDFNDEPDYIKELAAKAYEGSLKPRYNYIKPLGSPLEYVAQSREYEQYKNLH